MRAVLTLLLTGALVGCADTSADSSSSSGGFGLPRPGVDAGASGDPGQGGNGGGNGGGGQNGGGGGGGSSDDGEGCQELVIRAKPNAPDVLIVLDRSGSMMGIDLGGGSGTVRWPGCIAALKSVTAQFDERIRFGLMMFPTPSDFTPLSCAPGKVDVAMNLGTAAQISQALDAATPTLGATPTAQTLQNARMLLGDRNPAPDEEVTPAYVLLVTDGKPTCPNGGGSENAQDVALTEQALDDLLAHGVKTYVIGYDTASIAAALDSFAMHGGTNKHYPVDNEAALVQEFSRIAGDLVSCSYDLDAEPEDPAYVLVEIDGEAVRYNDANGWKLNGKTIELQGGACNKVRSPGDHVVSVVAKCDPVVIL